MSVQTITGIREYDFTDDSGRQVTGLSVYYAKELNTENGLTGKGFTVGKLAVKQGTALYKKMLNADYSKPFEADVKFDILPGSSKPVLEDILFKK